MGYNKERYRTLKIAAYYILLTVWYLLSLFPLWIHYLLSDLLYLIGYILDEMLFIIKCASAHNCILFLSS